MPNKRHVRLNNARDVQKLLSRLINERRRGEIGSDVCRDIGYLSKILLEAYDKGEIQERIESIESKMDEKGIS